MRKLSIWIVVCGLLISCQEKSTSPGDGSFMIRVIDEMQRPVPGAYIRGGFDWDMFSVTSNDDGFAVLPEYALNVTATISKDNFISIVVNHLNSEIYALARAPLQLVKIGDIDGDAVKFTADRVITVTYQGKYRVYGYDNNGVEVLAEDTLDQIVRDFKLLGDTLWSTSFDDGIYAYSVADPLHPRMLLRVDIPGILRPFAGWDNLMAVGYEYGPGPIRIFRFDTTGTTSLLGTIGNFIVSDMTFLSHYLVTVSRWPATANVFDIGDPTEITPVYSGNFGEYGNAIIHGDSILAGSGTPIESPYQYVMLDLSDPSNPTENYTFSVPGTIDDIVQDSLAVGKYYNDWYANAIFRRTDHATFEPLAIISQPTGMPGFGGSFPPYFIISSSLYKLVPWEN
jgi:hypothetical protein